MDTDQINAIINIRDIAARAGFTIDPKTGRGPCPIHGGDNATAFHLYEGGTRWKCFTRQECNAHGSDGIAFIMALNRCDFKTACRMAGATDIDPQEVARRAAENARRIEQELQQKINEAQKALEELRSARRWLEYHENLDERAREIWRARGVPDEWQGFYRFGYSHDFRYKHAGCWYTSPTLTLPIYAINDDEPVNIRHRILQPVDPKDKYRPERSGLPSVPFYGDYTLPIGAARRVIVVEGEIKAAVTFLTLDMGAVQVVGLPGKEAWRNAAKELKGHDGVLIIPDPGALQEADALAREIGGAKVIEFQRMKIDDAIVQYKLDRSWIIGLLNTGRMVK